MRSRTTCSGGARLEIANLTSRDAEEFLALSRRVPVRTEVTNWLLVQANEAMEALGAGRIRGAAVLVP